jgi:hypothetical protein
MFDLSLSTFLLEVSFYQSLSIFLFFSFLDEIVVSRVNETMAARDNRSSKKAETRLSNNRNSKKKKKNLSRKKQKL